MTNIAEQPQCINLGCFTNLDHFYKILKVFVPVDGLLINPGNSKPYHEHNSGRMLMGQMQHSEVYSIIFLMPGHMIIINNPICTTYVSVTESSNTTAVVLIMQLHMQYRHLYMCCWHHVCISCIYPWAMHMHQAKYLTMSAL